VSVEECVCLCMRVYACVYAVHTAMPIWERTFISSARKRAPSSASYRSAYLASVRTIVNEQPHECCTTRMLQLGSNKGRR
jgi:hypothetical protein